MNTRSTMIRSLFLALACTATPSLKSAEKPNVILIMVGDKGYWDIGA